MKKTYRALSAGELSEDMYGRYDVEKYGTGCIILNNMIIMAQGGIFKRPGTKFDAEAGKSDKLVRLIPFEFSTVQAYKLEFGDYYMRVFKNDQQVLEAAKTITAITQANPAQITIAGHGWSTGDEVYLDADIGGMTDLRGRNLKITVTGTDTFTVPVDTTGMPAFTAGGTAARVYQIVTPYSENDIWGLYVAQTADIMTLVHLDHPVRELTRTGHTSWTLSTPTFAPTIAAPTGQSATNSVGSGGVTYQYVITAVADETYEESLPSAVASCTNNLATSGNYNTVSWSAVAGAIKYNIYKSELGTYGFIGTVGTTSFKDDNIDPDISDTPPTARNPFNATDNYPSVVGFQQQRRVFAATRAKPDTIFMSRAGQYRNLSISIPNKDDDAITFAIASGQVNKINHLISLRDLLAMTVGNEFKIYGANGSYTPTDMVASPETNYGSQGGSEVQGALPSVKPILIGNTAIFAAKYGRSVRDYAYTFESDGFDGNDLSILSKHLLEDRYIVDWAFAQEPDKLIWAVMSDGKLCSLTYMREHKVWGWARHETDGFVESVCVVPDDINRRDSVSFVASRTVGGVEKRYIEHLERYIDRDIKKSYFLDCGLSYSGAPITSVGGLWHLEGRVVEVYADGNCIGTKTVANGRITLDDAAGDIHVGLSYVSECQPLPPESDQGPYGSTTGDPKSIRGVTVQVVRTRGLECSQSPDDTEYQAMQPTFPGLDMSQTIQPVTGVVELPIQPSWSPDMVAPYLIHRKPLPCKIITVSPDYA